MTTQCLENSDDFCNQAPIDIASYEMFLDELDKVWTECLRILLPGGRAARVAGDRVDRSRSKNHDASSIKCRLCHFNNLPRSSPSISQQCLSVILARPRSTVPEVTVLDVFDQEPRRVPSRTWRELIKKVWEVDPLSCPRCGYAMKLISHIDEPDVIARILRHLGLWKQDPEPGEEEIKAPEDGPVVMESFDEGWPGYEEPVIITH